MNLKLKDFANQITIYSGGQTGADQAGLDVAIRLGLPTSGWVPKGCIVQNYEGQNISDYTLLERYGLQEAKTSNYAERTRLNVSTSNGTMLFGYEGSPGAKLAIKTAKEFFKPILIISKNPSLEDQIDWLKTNNIQKLNIAGNRFSRYSSSIYFDTAISLLALLCEEKTEILSLEASLLDKRHSNLYKN